jgi:hypothetical protein
MGPSYLGTLIEGAWWETFGLGLWFQLNCYRCASSLHAYNLGLWHEAMKTILCLLVVVAFRSLLCCGFFLHKSRLLIQVVRQGDTRYCDLLIDPSTC